MRERGLSSGYITIFRRVPHYVPEINKGMVRSTVLGGAAAYELNDTGSVVQVYAEGAELARLTQSNSLSVVEYRRADPLTGTWVQVGQRREPDPLGSEAGEWNPYVSSNPPFDPLDPTGTGAFKEMGDIGDIRGSCVFYSMPMPCSSTARYMNAMGSTSINGLVMAGFGPSEGGLPPDYNPDFIEWVESHRSAAKTAAERERYDDLASLELGIEWWQDLRGAECRLPPSQVRRVFQDFF
jgi:hypothetical protein